MKGPLSKRHSTRREGSFPIGHAPRRSCQTPSWKPGCAGGFVRSSPGFPGKRDRTMGLRSGRNNNQKSRGKSASGGTKGSLESSPPQRAQPLSPGGWEGARGGGEGLREGGRWVLGGSCPLVLVPNPSSDKGNGGKAGEEGKLVRKENPERRKSL